MVSSPNSSMQLASAINLRLETGSSNNLVIAKNWSSRYYKQWPAGEQ